MAKKRKGNLDAVPETLFSKPEVPPPPDFYSLLRDPVIKDENLPAGFNESEEAAHLNALWDRVTKLHPYQFADFIFAGGSGMVFKVFRGDSTTPLALKVARKRLMDVGQKGDAAKALSPVSEAELKALERLSHPNVVRLYDAIEEPGTDRVLAIATTYVERPLPLNVYLSQTLKKHPDPTGEKGIHAFSPQRLDDASRFLLRKCQEIASALAHMHSLQIYHLDVKPANILIASIARHPAILTDMGSCIHAEEMKPKEKIRVHFTWTYAHPDLTNISHDPGSISGGGLRASAATDKVSSFPAFDLYAFGKTMQEALGILVDEFGERCFASYTFRYLQFVACLLLDGHNAPAEANSPRLKERDNKRFVQDVALGYPTDLFARHRITSAADLKNCLDRHR